MFTELIKAWNWLKAPMNKSNLYCERASGNISVSFKHFLSWNKNEKREGILLALKMSPNFVFVPVPARMVVTISSAALPFTGCNTPVHFGHRFDLPIKVFIKYSSQAIRKPLILPVFPHKRSSISLTQKGRGLLKQDNQGQNIWYYTSLGRRKKAENRSLSFIVQGRDNSCVTFHRT